MKRFLSLSVSFLFKIKNFIIKVAIRIHKINLTNRK